MSSAFRYNSKDKKIGKEPAKGSLKVSSHANISSGMSAGGYSPLLGTFHTFETAPLPCASTLQLDGRFRSIDDTDDPDTNAFMAGIEYDCVSNNGSWSGESEDHKEKTLQPPSLLDSVPGADNEKREKIRLKNEKKHQRQKERRAQELHERCSGYLMSRKLESLAQQLVAMGFSQERATTALIRNEGKVEQSVAWLFEGAEEDKLTEQNLDGGVNLKIDISEELAHIASLEIKYKASKQEVERAVVACEGNLDKAEETLQEPSPPSVPAKAEAIDPPTMRNSKLSPAFSQSSIRPTTSSIPIQQKGDDKNFNYAKPPGICLGSSADLGMKNMLAMKKIAPKADWSKSQQFPMLVEKSWPAGPSFTPSVSYPLALPPVQAPLAPMKTDPRFVSVTNDQLKNMQIGSVREPVILVQRPQLVNLKQHAPNPSPRVISSSSPGGRYPNIGQRMNPSNAIVPPVNVPQGLNSNDNATYNHFQYQSQQFGNSVDYSQGSSKWGGGNGGGLWSTNRGGPSPILAPASSLGLFSGGASVDWSKGGPVFQIDYSSIDWTLDYALLSDSRPSHAGSKLALQNNNRIYEPLGCGFDNISTTRHGLSDPSIYEPQYGGSIYGMRDSPSMYGLRDVPSEQSIGGGSQGWTSPFAEKDLFSLPRQFL